MDPYVPEVSNSLFSSFDHLSWSLKTSISCAHANNTAGGPPPRLLPEKKLPTSLWPKNLFACGWRNNIIKQAPTSPQRVCSVWCRMGDSCSQRGRSPGPHRCSALGRRHVTGAVEQWLDTKSTGNSIQWHLTLSYCYEQRGGRTFQIHAAVAGGLCTVAKKQKTKKPLRFDSYETPTPREPSRAGI